MFFNISTFIVISVGGCSDPRLLLHWDTTDYGKLSIGRFQIEADEQRWMVEGPWKTSVSSGSPGPSFTPPTWTSCVCMQQVDA